MGEQNIHSKYIANIPWDHPSDDPNNPQRKTFATKSDTVPLKKITKCIIDLRKQFTNNHLFLNSSSLFSFSFKETKCNIVRS